MGFLTALVGAGATLIGLVILGAIFLMGLSILKHGKGPTVRGPETDEARLIQEIYQGMENLERRVETLETLLMDSRKQG